MLNNIGLYYPFIQFNMGGQEEWLKLAVLYWDKLGRIALPEYNIRDTETVQQLVSDLGFIINFEPSQEEMNNIGSQFLTLLKQHHKELLTVYHTHVSDDLTSLSEYRQSWGQQWPSPLRMGRYWSPLPQLSPQPHLAYIFYSGRMTNELKDALVEAGLALPLQKAPHLIGVHPRLAFVYMEALAEAMATARRLYPVTHDDLAHLAVSGYTLERLTQALIDWDGMGVRITDRTVTEHEIETQMALVALQSVIPKGIQNVPIKKIIALRKQHSDEFAAFHEYLQEFVTEIGELRDVKDPKALQAHLEAEYEKKLKPQLDDIEKCLRSLGIETVLGAMNIRVALPTLVTTGGAYLSQAHLGSISPILIGAGAAAFSILPVIRDKGKEARDKVHPSPAAYLFSIRENLSPSTLMDQITRRARSFVFRV